MIEVFQEKPWPAVTLQGIFLASNIACLLSGQCNGFILASMTVLMILFTIQTTTKNPRFLWLFPVRLPERIPTASWDTLILRALIVSSIILFYIGVTRSYGWPVVFLVILLLAFAVVFPKIWDKWLDERNKKEIACKVEEGLKRIREKGE